jgi:hypothetical protein
VLAALPFFEIEPERDTIANLEVPREVRRAVRLPKPERATAAGGVCIPIRRGAPIDPSKQLEQTALSRLRVREALVKLQTEKPKPKAAFRVPDVRIACVRSSDRAQRISRDGADGFAIEGLAGEDGRISVAIDGLIFTARTNPGDTAASVLAQLARRLELGYEVEVIESTELRASARLSSR